MSEYRNCEIGERYATYVCQFLLESKGPIKVDEMTKLSTMEKLGHRVSVKVKGRIVLLNFCPFCGAPVINLKSFENEGGAA